MDKIINYGTLKAAITGYLHRTDQEANIPLFISLGISKINRECKSVHQEQAAVFTAPAGTTLVALPTRFKAMRSVTVDGAPLRQISLQQLHSKYLQPSGTPRYYVVADNRLTIHPSPDGAVELRMVYFDTVPDFADGSDTHPLLVANPNIFIYSAMREASPFLHGDERGPIWQELLNQEIVGENNSSEESRWSGSPLQIESCYMETP